MIITGKSKDVPARDLHDGQTVFHVKKRVLIGPAQEAQNYVMRLFTLGKDGVTPYHAHPWEHEVFVLAGKGAVRAEDGDHLIEKGDFAYVPPNEAHQFLNVGEDALEFICIVPINGESQG